ncbi:MAG: hypothetical protein IPM03_21470 [Sulfuritalea sp.]|nr:hypothetical protein [Sulfuritalea sp.]
MPTKGAAEAASSHTLIMYSTWIAPSSEAVLVLLAMVLWLFNHAYQGIYHDAVIYSVFASRWLDPAAYSSELLFRYGSQDDFSIFSAIYGSLGRLVGLDAAAQAVVLGGGGLWVLASLTLARSMFRPIWQVALAVLICAVIKFSYSPNFGTFTFNENFASPRSLSIPFAVLALAAFLARRHAIAAMLTAISISLHPLLGIWVPLLAFSRAVSTKWLCITTLLLLATTFAGSMTFGIELLQVMDSVWIDAVRETTPNEVFLGGWGVLRLPDILLACGILWLAGRIGSTKNRELFLRLCLLTVAAIFGAQFCSYFWPIQLAMQVQPWRVLWLAELLAVFAVVDLLGVAALAGRRYLLAALGVSAVAWGVPEARPLIPFLGLALLCIEQPRRLLDQQLDFFAARPILTWVVGGGLVLILLPNYWISLELRGHEVLAGWMPDIPAAKGFLIMGGEGLFLLLLGFGLQNCIGRWIIFAVSLPLLVVALNLWDVRGESFRRKEGDFLLTRSVSWASGLPINRGDIVVWRDQRLAIWLVLRASVYAAPEHVVGSVFSRARMVEAKRRLERVSISALPAGIDMTDRVSALAHVHRGIVAAGSNVGNLLSYGRGAVSEPGIFYLCQDQILDWIVSELPRAGKVSGLRFDPGPSYGGIQYLFDCRDFRRRGQVDG